VKFSPLYIVKQNLPDRGLSDIPGAVRAQLETAAFAARVKPGARIAIGAGSRGIANIDVILRAAVDYWKDHGAKPFIFPAMGSHGAATAEGQASVLAHYGIHEAAMGCPIVSSLDVVSTGPTPEGIETFLDKHAFESDGVMLVGRVKWHTDFSGAIESGLAKMTAIGVGKLAGARQYHAFGHHAGLEKVIRSVYRQVAASGKILGGLAILEDANHSTARVAALATEHLIEEEEKLLALVKSWKARIPVEALDVLIVDEAGKNFSGAGMDTKVINRGILGERNPFSGAPLIDRIFLRGLSEHSYGNAVGIGLADIVSDRLLGSTDWQATYINSLTACTPTAVRTPIHFPTDRECLERIAPTTGRLDLADVTFGWMANSMDLSLFAISENLLPEIRKNPALEIDSGPFEFEFDANGNLSSLEKFAAR
jgi:hypothetical protein